MDRSHAHERHGTGELPVRDMAEDVRTEREFGGSDAHAFLLRVRLDPMPGPASLAHPRIRLEHINGQTIWNFSDIDSALVRLRSCLETVVNG